MGRPSRSAALARPALVLAALAAPTLASCVGEAVARPISLRDPLGLIEDSQELRLLLMPAETHVCDSATGAVLPMVPEAGVGMTEGAVVDLLLTSAGGAIMREVSVPPGSYVALVRGKGRDPVSGVPNTIIATGCAEVLEVRGNESRSVVITLNPVVTMGICSDTILSPDEQCTTPGVGDCSADCQTTPFPINTMLAAGAQEMPRVAGRGNQRALATFVSERIQIGARVLGADGRPLTMPALLVQDADVSEVLRDNGLPTLAGSPIAAWPAVARDGRMAIAATLVPRSGEFDVQVGFFTSGRVPEGAFVSARANDANSQTSPVGAFADDGSYLVAFVDAALGGVSARAFAAGARTPSGGDAVLVGMGARPAVAGLSSGFVVAFERGEDVLVQRLDSTGALMGAAVPAFEGAGVRSQPAVAALSGGGFVVVFRDTDVDANGSGIRGVIFGADGARVRSFQVNSVVEGDQGAPSVAAHADRIAVAFESGGGVQARFFTVAGEPALNRERTPTVAQFPVAAGATDPSVSALGEGSTASWLFVFRTQADGLGDIAARRIPR
jgi:hypothetical protein